MRGRGAVPGLALRGSMVCALRVRACNEAENTPKKPYGSPERLVWLYGIPKNHRLR